MSKKIRFSLGLIVLVLLVLLSASSCRKHSVNNITLEASLQQTLNKYTKEKKLPGLSLFVQSASGNIQITAGLSNIADQRKMTATDICYTQSISKTFTAIAVLRLQEQGKLTLSDPISRYLDPTVYNNLTNGNTITIRQLLNHTSGLYDYLKNDQLYSDLFDGTLFPITPQKILHYVYNKPASFLPGAGYEYANINYTLAALIINRASGKDHGQFIKEEIIDKLSLSNTFYLPSAAQVPVSRIVTSYRYNPGTQKFDDVSDWQYQTVEGFIGDDGIISTTGDIAIFYKKLLTENILLSQNSMQQMLAWTQSSIHSKYGLGISEVNSLGLGNIQGHEGAGLGAGCKAYYIPAKKATIVLMTNAGVLDETDPSWLNFEKLFGEIQAVLAQKL